MKKLTSLLFLSLLLSISAFGAEVKKGIVGHLQDVSVTIRAEADGMAGEGSGVIYTRKNCKGDGVVNFVWTAAHVVDILRTERKVVVNGVTKSVVEFKDALIIKEIKQDGRTVGRLQMDAEVLKYSDSENGHDLALLRIRKASFITDTVVFYLDGEIPALGTDLLHVGSLLGQMGANSLTSGIYSQHGRLIKSLNKFVFDQTTCTAFPGSSGGGVFLKANGDARYIGMLVRGAGEGFNLIVPVRRMVEYCTEQKIMWALDPKLEMPAENKLRDMPIEESHSTLKDKENDKHEHGKNFPFMIRLYVPRQYEPKPLYFNFKE